MSEKRPFEFFVLRYMPDTVKEEFVNIGLVMLEPDANGNGFAGVRFRRDWRRVWCLDPQADIEVLEAVEKDIRQQLTNTHDRTALMQKLQDSFSNLIQLSPVKACLAEEPANEMELLSRLYFETPKQTQPRLAGGRQQILGKMRAAFEQAGVLEFLTRNIRVSSYTRPGDPYAFDFGYRVGNSLKLFHAVSLKVSVEQAVSLASRYSVIARKMPEKIQATPFLTAVVEESLDHTREEVQFALGMMEEAQIRVAPVSEVEVIAGGVRRELGLSV